jgi:hypothetical protein
MQPITATEIYISEIETQCKYAEFALSDLDDCLSGRNNDIRRFWYSMQSFLIAAANISKILWPDRRASERGAALRAILSIGDDSPIKSRLFRNHFEHYDERIQEWFDSPRDGGFVDCCIGGEDSFGGGLGKPNYMRNFDPRRGILYFRGEAYEFRPIIEALREIRRQIHEYAKTQGGMLGFMIREG